jgi:hypothetical protein
MVGHNFDENIIIIWSEILMPDLVIVGLVILLNVSFGRHFESIWRQSSWTL